MRAIRDCAGVIDSVTCSVAVPSADGRAGMAAVIVDDTSSLAQSPTIWRAGFRRTHPLFLRVRRSLDTTETFKLKKQQLVREGFDPDPGRGAALFLGSGNKRRIDRSMRRVFPKLRMAPSASRPLRPRIWR